MNSSCPDEPIRVLVIEDDEDDYFLTKTLFSDIKAQRYQLDWKNSYVLGLMAAIRNQHDVCLVDYRLGSHTGVELLKATQERGCRIPIILLTGQGEHEVDLEAMKAGAADYLIKGGLQHWQLERSIRYAIDRRRAALQAAADQTRLAALGTNVGLALTRRDSLPAILHCCAKAMAHYLNVTVARICIYDPVDGLLKPQASHAGLAGTPMFDLLQPKVSLNVEELSRGQPTLINNLATDPRLHDPRGAAREGLVSYAAYPLLLEDRLVGLLEIASRDVPSNAILQEMSSVANGIALCIERKRSEEALDISEFRYRSVVENVKQIIFQLDEKGRWTFLNPAWTEITGFDVEDTLGSEFSNFVHPEDRERHCVLMKGVIEFTTSYCRDEVRYLAKDGSFRRLQLYAYPIIDEGKARYGAAGTMSDITERERLAAFPRYNPDPVMEMDADGTVTYANDAARTLAEALQISKPAALLPADAAAIARECLCTGHHKLRHEVPLNQRTLTWSFFPITSIQVVHCYGADITERISLEAQFRHAQKLESVGQLAAGVAHDFNNILTVIQGHTDRLIRRCDGDNSLTDPLNQISASAQRAAALTRQLLVFSRKQVIQLQALELNALLGNLTKMLQRLLGEDVALETRPAPDLPIIEGDTGMIEQIIMNLAVNARDAMPRGGRLNISTEVVDVGEDYLRQHSDARVGHHVALSVTDTGCGMSKETLERIFEPFFTTKEVGKGTGLGLATVYGITRQHQGWVEVASEVRVGTTFKIFFPVSNKTIEAAVETPLTSRDVRDGHETILLVEDEPILRELACLVLKDYKYEVLEAGSGPEALRIWDSHQGKVDLLLTDMVMPEGMTGCELAERLRISKPDLKVILSTGYSADIINREVPLHGAVFLQKPYPPPLLAKTVRTCLDRKGSD